MQMNLFHKLAGFYGVTQKNFDTSALNDGLRYLQVVDASAELSNIKCPIKAITARNDKIVPLEIAKKIWTGYDLDIFNEGGHSIPYSKVDECEISIKKFLTKYEL